MSIRLSQSTIFCSGSEAAALRSARGNLAHSSHLFTASYPSIQTQSRVLSFQLQPLVTKGEKGLPRISQPGFQLEKL